MARGAVQKVQENISPLANETKDSLAKGAVFGAMMRSKVGELAEGVGALAGVRFLAYQVIAESTLEERELHDKMEVLNKESAERKEALAESIKKRDAPEAYVSSLKMFSWSKPWTYVIGGLCFGVACSVVFVVGRSAWNNGCFNTSESAPTPGVSVLDSQVASMVVEAKKAFSFREGLRLKHWGDGCLFAFFFRKTKEGESF